MTEREKDAECPVCRDLRMYRETQAMSGAATKRAAEAMRARAIETEAATVRIGEEEDEIVTHGVIHVERMSDRHIWANLGGVAFDFVVVKGKLAWRVQDMAWADLARAYSGLAALRAPASEGEACEHHWLGLIGGAQCVRCGKQVPLHEDICKAIGAFYAATHPAPATVTEAKP